MGCNPALSHQPSITVINNQIHGGGRNNDMNSKFLKQSSGHKQDKIPDSENLINQYQNVNCQYYLQNDNALNEAIKSEEPKAKIELILSLIDTNSSGSDTYTISLGLHTKHTKGIVPFGSTDTKHGGAAKVNFNKTFVTDYFFEVKQTLTATLLVNDKPLYKMDTTIGKIMGSKGQILLQEFDIVVPNKENFVGKIQCVAVPVESDDKELILSIVADLRKSIYQPYFLLKRNIALKDHQPNWINAYKSEVIKSYPIKNDFASFQLSTQFLCNSDLNKQILIEFYDYTTHNFIGKHLFTVNNLVPKVDKKDGGHGIQNTKSIVVTDEKGALILDNKIQITSKTIKKFKFLDYIRGGLQINMIVGIDFTGSNGNPYQKDSLHSIEKQPNLYEKAIESSCKVVAFYDADQLFPVYGYGAILKSSPVVNHCFSLNMSSDPNIFTVDGILACYREFIKEVKLYGPTFFGPMIQQAIVHAKDAESSDDYCILMILTDGIINDMQETVDAIVEASYLPISIIIVGVGNGGDDGFAEMDFLDGDEEPLASSKNKKCARDIVQFVEFTKFDNDAVKLSEQVLEEVPKQLEDYFKMKNKPPGDPIIF